MDAQRWLTFDLFAGRVGEQFVVSADGVPPTSMVLADATESAESGGPGPEDQQRMQFSLVFTGPAEPALRQAIYGLEHPDLGHLDLFLVPIGPTGEQMRYEAVFA